MKPAMGGNSARFGDSNHPTKTLFDLVRMGTRAVPAVKYAVGVGGILAICALIRPFFETPGSAFLAVVLMLIVMWALLMFAAAVKQGPAKFQLPVLVLTWALIVLFLACCCLTASCAFFNRPKSLPELIQQIAGGASVQTTTTKTSLEGLALDTKFLVEPTTSEIRVGEKLGVKVFVLDTKNQPIKVVRDIAVTIEANGPSGTIQKRNVVFSAADQSVTVQFETQEPGLWQIKAYSTDAHIVPASTTVLVRTADAAAMRYSTLGLLRTDKGPLWAIQPRGFRPLPTLYAVKTAPFLTDAALRSGAVADTSAITVDPPNRSSTDGAKIVLTVSGAEKVRADGKDAALVQAFYISSGPAPSDIRILLDTSLGYFDQNPITIPKSSYLGETRLRSSSAGIAHLKVLYSVPAYEVEAKQLQVRFASPISAIELRAPQQVPFFGHGQVVVTLIDEEGRPAETTSPMEVNLSTPDDSVQVQPRELTIRPGSSSASAAVVPTRIGGNAHIEAAVSGLLSVLVTFRITGSLELVLLWLTGSVLAILTAWNLAKQTWSARRLIAGFVGSATLVCALLFGLLPQTYSTLFHSALSVFMVCFLGSFSAIRATDHMAAILFPKKEA